MAHKLDISMTTGVKIGIQTGSPATSIEKNGNKFLEKILRTYYTNIMVRKNRKFLSIHKTTCCVSLPQI